MKLKTVAICFHLSPYVCRLVDFSSPEKKAIISFLRVIAAYRPSSVSRCCLLSAVFVCCTLCLLSSSWALVLYSRACSLVRPGHLPMPPAALLCQLLWRASMLGARIASLMFFMRVFCGWIYGVIGEARCHLFLHALWW